MEKIVILSSSPRRGGNSDTLCDEFLRGASDAGDIMLYGSSSLVVFYETFSAPYSYTRIGQIDHASGLKAALGRGDVTIKFELE